MSDDNNVNGSVEPNARDGFRVKTHEDTVGSEISLWLEFMQDGIPQEQYSCQLASWPKDTLENSGQRQRLLAVATAMARFINLGGLAFALQDLARMLNDTGVQLDWEARGWRILDTKQEPGDTSEVCHYFINDKGQVLVWAEDSSVEITTLAKLEEELDADAREGILDWQGLANAGQDPVGSESKLLSGPDSPG